MIGNVNVPGASAADIATVSSVANEALNKANQALSSGGSNGSCIVCSTTKPNALEKGLWIKTDLTNKNINITNNFQIQEDDTIEQLEGQMPFDVYGAASAYVNGKLYIFGGTLTSNDVQTQNKIQCYDIINNTTSIMNAVLFPDPYTATITNMSTIVYGNKVYIFGAYAKRKYYANGGQTYYNEYGINSIQYYDTTLDEMVDTGISLPNFPIDKLKVCKINNKVYIFGLEYMQYTSNNYLYRRLYPNIYCYDLEENTISTMNATLPLIPDTKSPLIIDGDMIYILGGYEFRQTSANSGIYERSSGTNNAIFSPNIFCYNTKTDEILILNRISPYTPISSIAINSFIINNTFYTFYKNISKYDLQCNRKTSKNLSINEDTTGTCDAVLDEDNNVYVLSRSTSYHKNVFKLHINDLNIDDSLTDSIVISIDYEYFVKCPINKIDQNIYDYRSIDAIYYVDEDNNLHPLQFYRIENYEVVI